MNVGNVVHARPFLRWAGSKRKVLPELKQFFPSQVHRYLEPFAGSACLFFTLAPRRAVLSDLNPELMNTYRAVRAEPTRVGKILSSMPVSEKEYYSVRELKSKSLTQAEQAARFIYLNRFCFNGLYRTNLKGEFNVPYGAPKNYIVPTTEELKRCSAALQNTTIMTGDFEKVVGARVKPGDFVYLDPPFFQSTRRVFREYNSRPFEAADLARLTRLLRLIDEAGATFVVSYAACPEARAAFKGWRCSEIQTTRNISGFTCYRRIAIEIVVTNAAIPKYAQCSSAAVTSPGLRKLTGRSPTAQ